MPRMSSGNLRIRRATLDDLAALRPLWNSMRFDIAMLERRLTEYQVAVDANEQVVGGLGLQIVGRHACLHSEAFPDFALTDHVRPLFWERIQALALNHGIARLWTREDAPFWKQNGFQPAKAEALKRLPAEVGSPDQPWLTLSLKDEDTVVSLEKELALFMQSEKQHTQKALKQAKMLKNIATVIALIFGILVLAGMIYLVKKNAGGP
jgi:N-acetylglutamate synthase-like GNAT family acetyltransferase